MTKRDWPKLHLDVIKGRSAGKIIWQPCIGAWYQDRIFQNIPLPVPYTGMSKSQLYRALDCSARIYEFTECLYCEEDKRVHLAEKKDGDLLTITAETPVGSQVEIRQLSPNSRGVIHKKWPVSDRNDMRIMLWRMQRRTWKWDHEKYQHILAEWGDLGAPTLFTLGRVRTNILALYYNLMGVENTIAAIYDWPNLIDAYCEVWEEEFSRIVDVYNECPVEIINFGDCVHSGLLSPKLFLKYILPAYQLFSDKLHAGKKFVHAHWDGDVRPLLPYIQDTGLDGIEAITPVPQGDVELDEMRSALGDNMFLIDGIPALLFEESYSEQELIDCTKNIIELFAPNLILGISDEISYNGDINRIKLVGEIVDAYNNGF